MRSKQSYLMRVFVVVLIFNSKCSCNKCNKKQTSEKHTDASILSYSWPSASCIQISLNDHNPPFANFEACTILLVTPAEGSGKIWPSWWGPALLPSITGMLPVYLPLGLNGFSNSGENCFLYNTSQGKLWLVRCVPSTLPVVFNINKIAASCLA